MGVNLDEMERVEHFTIGEGNFPNWFNEALVKGRAKVDRDEYDGSLKNIVVKTVSGSVKGKIGDVILNTRSGILVVPREKATKYL